MLTAFGPIGRWKLAGGNENNPDAGGGDGGAADALLRRRRALQNYQRFRHHLWLVYHLLGG